MPFEKFDDGSYRALLRSAYHYRARRSSTRGSNRSIVHLLFPDCQRNADIAVEVEHHARCPEGIDQNELRRIATAIRNLRKDSVKTGTAVMSEIGNVATKKSLLCPLELHRRIFANVLSHRAYPSVGACLLCTDSGAAPLFSASVHLNPPDNQIPAPSANDSLDLSKRQRHHGTIPSKEPIKEVYSHGDSTVIILPLIGGKLPLPVRHGEFVKSHPDYFLHYFLH